MKYRTTATLTQTVGLRRPYRLDVSYQTIGIVVAAAEAAMIVVGSAFGPLAYGWISSVPSGPSSPTLGAGLLASVLYVSAARSSGLYRLPPLIEPRRHLRRIALTCGAVLLFITAVLFMLKIGSTISRGAFLGGAMSMLALCVLTRMEAATVLASLMARGGVLGRPAFLIGEADELASLNAELLLRQFGLREVGRLAFDAPGRPIDRLGAIDEAVRLARLSCAREFVVAARLDRIEPLTAVEDALRLSPLPVRLLPNQVFRAVLSRHPAKSDASLHLIDLRRAPLGRAEQMAKRGIDVAGAGLALVLLAPILVLAACAIRLDTPGPIVFRQRRTGFDQQEFVIFKFRTMTALDDGSTIVQAKPGDPRITRVGRMLRRTSVDELPQLINVLKGDMSLVGPRPHAVAHDGRYKDLISRYCLRHHVKPGITGWAQVNGLRGETTRTEQMSRRIELDLWYIDNWSLGLDLRILLRTSFEMFRQDAY